MSTSQNHRLAPNTRVGANTPSKPRGVRNADPALSTFFLLSALASLLIVPAAVAILIWALGWSVLFVIAAAFALFVAILMVRAWIADRRAARRTERGFME